MATLGTAYVQIVPSAQGIKGSLEKTLGGEAASAGTSVGSKIGAFAKKALIAAGIGAALAKVVKGSMDEGAKLQQSYLGGLDTLYGEAAEGARKYAREAAAAGISMNEYSEQAVSFGAALKNAYGGDTAKAMEAANKAILDMADNSAKMGTDIGSVQMAYQGFAKQNYTMLDNLKLGYGGTKSEMERLLADAQKLSGVEYNIDNLGDVYDAIHVIQEDLGLSGVAAKEASETFSGSLGAMKAAFDNFKGSLALGEGVQESLSTLMTTASTFFFGNFIPMLGTIIRGIPVAVWGFLSEGIPLLLSNISTMVTNLATSLSSSAKSLTASNVSSWVSTTIPKIVVAGAKIIVKFASTLLQNLPKIAVALVRIGATIVRGLGSAIYGKVTAAANGIKDRFLKPINAIKDKVKAVVDRIKSIFNVQITMPKIRIPKLHISGGKIPWGIGGKGTPPNISFSGWYDKGGIFDRPSIIGVGEKRPEFVGALDDLRNIVREESGGTINVVININGSDKSPKKIAKEVKGELVAEVKRGRLAWQ